MYTDSRRPPCLATAISRLQAIQSPASATVGRVDTSEGLGVRCVEESQRIWREVARGGARQPRTKLAVAGHSFAGKTLPRRLDQPRQSLAKRGRTPPFAVKEKRFRGIRRLELESRIELVRTETEGDPRTGRNPDSHVVELFCEDSGD
ncbi:hypothetical protein B0H14DRAFT_2624910 [Mycena olivaceomarginata]|nr:hypothetical protein B0H14DRAFT_2624910 [Mycena olivaceomarginata]